MYSSIDTIDIEPPNIIDAYYTDTTKKAIEVVFNHNIIWPMDTLGYRMRDYFYSDSSIDNVDNVTVTGNRLILQLKTPFTSNRISYIPDRNYWDTVNCYEGPWITNSRGIGALTFHDYPIGLTSNTSISNNNRFSPIAKNSLMSAASEKIYNSQGRQVPLNDLKTLSRR
jgi:hypothetical protein